ncbi:MAG: hypothetical protein LUC50_05630 [Ruminococcus sp.]|nr:hypothetical protein [Ruminococcus sp.]
MISDEEYFNRKATVLEYDRQIMRGNVKPVSTTTDPEQLYKEARQTVGNISFAEMTKKYPDLFEIHNKKETLLDLGMATFIGLTSGMINEIFVGVTGENKSWSQLSDQHAEKKWLATPRKSARTRQNDSALYHKWRIYRRSKICNEISGRTL